MKTTIKGLDLAEHFFLQIVQPLISNIYPDLSYAVGLIGEGSEIIGFDDEISKDHNWGPRLQIFLQNSDHIKLKENLDKFFANNLPNEFMGFSTHWTPPDPEDNGTRLLQKHESGKINHGIEILSIKYYIREILSINSIDLHFKDWLIIPEQKLLEFTSGKIFRDDIGTITEIRNKLNFYPDSILRFKLIGCWDYISQESPFVGRIGAKGDDLGSRIITARITRMLTKIAYLLEKRYPPYSKWLSYGLNQLTENFDLKKLLEKALNTPHWRERENYLCDAILLLVDKQNKLQITNPIFLKPQQFFGRDIKIIDLKIVKKALWDEIKTNQLPKDLEIGGIDQFVDNALILSNSNLARQLINVYNES